MPKIRLLKKKLDCKKNFLTILGRFQSKLAGKPKDVQTNNSQHFKRALWCLDLAKGFEIQAVCEAG
jgi:hypothetical protein